ncbi:MAG: hypothetical protein DSM106950_35050 [Stigonema ocellatum SAG 48.90 = DSM 106950]|nr:hypothetical protein [Stigonema ocellatum SAG 48.90 = DSM 106950]
MTSYTEVRVPPRLLKVFFYPPMAIARLGGSNSPLESFTWQEDPTLRGAAKTIIEPAISLEIQPDGSVRPYLPSIIHFKDENLFRPVAPFFELWALLQHPDGSQEEVPLTSRILKQLDVPLDAVSYVVEAANLKAARRTGDFTCGFSTRIEVRASDYQRYSLLATSPHGPGLEPLVLPDQPIPLGHIQVIHPVDAVEMGVDLGVLRLRFTPAYGHVYGPPTATTGPAPTTGRIHEIVPQKNRILNPNSLWLKYDADYSRYNNPEPSDTYDGSDVNVPVKSEVSWGVVDDTCDGTITAFVVVGGERLTAMARFFSGPPDFAPDRRPFLSLADDLADRDDLPLPKEDDELLTTREIADLFQRVFETLSLINLDANRARALNENAGNNIPPQIAELPPRTDDGSMTDKDKPYADKVPDLIAKPVAHEHLPYSSVAESVHASLTEVEALIDFMRTFGSRVETLLRPPYGVLKQLSEQPSEKPNPRYRDARILRDQAHDMRMPPYMRDSDATALSLTRRQYNQIMAFVERLQAPVTTESRTAEAVISSPPPIATPVRQHVERVVARRSQQQEQ